MTAAAVHTCVNEAVEIGLLFQSLDGLDKLSKCFMCAIDILKQMTEIEKAPACNIVRGQSKDFTNVYGLVKMYCNGRDFVAPQKDGEYFFWKVRWQNTAMRASLLACQTLQTASFLDSVEMINLGKIANSIGQTPILGAITSVPMGAAMGGLFLATAGFGLWDSALDLSESLTAKQTLQQTLHTWKHLNAQDEFVQIEPLLSSSEKEDYNAAPSKERFISQLAQDKVTSLDKEDKNLKKKLVKSWVTVAVNVMRVAASVFALSLIGTAIYGIAIPYATYITLAVSFAAASATLAEFIIRKRL